MALGRDRITILVLKKVWYKGEGKVIIELFNKALREGKHLFKDAKVTLILK